MRIGTRDKPPKDAAPGPIVSCSAPRRGCATRADSAPKQEPTIGHAARSKSGCSSLGPQHPECILPVFKSLVLVGVTTVGLLILDHFFALRHVTLVYLVPVVIAATKLGIVPAVIAAIAGAGASAFFFYPRSTASRAGPATSD